MIHILGMSHAINVLKAGSPQPLSFSHENWLSFSTGGRFIDLPARPGLVPGDAIKAFIITPAAGWGPVAELRNVGGQMQIAAAAGFWQLMASIEPGPTPGLLCSFIHGNEHSMLSLLQHPQPFDFVWPARADLAPLPGRQVLPLEVVTRQVQAALRPTLAALTALRRAAPQLRLVHVMPPPPVASEALIRKTPEVFAGQIARHGITPLSLRLKYYALVQDVTRQGLQPLGIEPLAPPEAALNDDGSLADDYVFGCTHGNEAYGALVLRQIGALAGAIGTTPAGAGAH